MALYHILPFTGLSRRKRGVMYGNIAHILESGVPVLRGMELLETQAPNRRFRTIFKNMKEHIRDGGDIGSAMETMPEYFPENEVQIIKSTESTGTVPHAFQRTSEYLIWYSDIVRQVLFQSAYPIFLLVFAFIGIPIIIGIATGNVGDVTSFILSSMAYGLVQIFLLIVLWKLLGKWSFTRAILDRIYISIPWVGSVVRQLSRARFARTYECMVSAGVPYFVGLRQSAESCGNSVIRKKIKRVIPMIEEGWSLSSALRETNEFTAISLSMLEVGEETGKMEESLRRFSHEEEQKATNNIQMMGRLLPPMIFIIVAIIIVFLVILPGFQTYFNMINSF